VDPVPDPLLLIKSGSAGNRTRTSGSVARNSDRADCLDNVSSTSQNPMGLRGVIGISLLYFSRTWNVFVSKDRLSYQKTTLVL
jgi:hypothetical protein